MPERAESRDRHRPPTATNRTAAQVNTTALLDRLRTAGPQSLSELVQHTGLSTATVNRLVDRLTADGRVLEAGRTVPTGGRPARLVKFNARARSVLALDIGGRKIAGAVTDLEARMVRRRKRSLAPGADGRPAGDFFEALADLAGALVKDAAQGPAPVHTVAVSVPGVVRRDTGQVEFAPSLQWFDLPLGALLEERLGLPVRVANDVNLLALAELRHGAARGRRDVLTVALGTGVGASLVLGGELYGGGAGAAGEIGYTLLGRQSLATPWPGFGDLESRVGTAGILARMRERRAGREALPAGFGSEDFLRLARSGDEAATAVLAELVDDLSLTIGNAATLLNPELVVLGGGFGRAAADLLVPAVQRRLQGRIPLLPALTGAALEDAQLVGAAELAIDSAATTPT
ncbi:ROK family protein [Streptomyces sp. NPDC004111]|uniref:ROK family transcriptional regulator n=1 Tax=Streptomyces sp. NPDC004111 TaxID=3364690 RepID=UPI0036C53810